MIGLDIKRDKDSIRSAVYETISKNSLKDAYIRVTVSRGAGPVGLDPELCKEPTFIIIAEEFREYPKSYYDNGIKTIIAETKRNIKEAINPQIKSLNFLNNILAKIEAKKKKCLRGIDAECRRLSCGRHDKQPVFVLSQRKRQSYAHLLLTAGFLTALHET